MTNRLWWIDPANLLVFFLLPLFVLSATYGSPLIPEFGSFVFLKGPMILLGTIGLALLAFGAKLGKVSTTRLDLRGFQFDRHRFDQILTLLILIALVAHLVLLAPLLARPGLMLSVLTGDKGASFVAKEAMTRIVGATSLTNITPLVFCMSALRFLSLGRFTHSPPMTIAMTVLPVLILIHAFVGSERIVLIENSIALFLPLLSYSRRLGTVGRVAPILGMILVIGIFAIGEYTRSWPYYHAQFDSFGQFVSLRLLAYIAIASNTGAGMIATMPPVGYPLITARWFTQIPLIGVPSTYTDRYFQSFGNVEFNNPSGVFGAIVDFGVPVGLLFLFLFGLILGIVYGLYARRNPVGLLAYPLLFTGLVDLTQIWYWGEPRFLPLLIALTLTVMLVVRREVRVRVA